MMEGEREMGELRFKSDTKHRKDWFTGISFSHPAKMSLPLQLWIIENYTKAGETILDPMAGSGTLMVACSMGRHCILLDLEQKFVAMMQANWEKVKQRGTQMGYTLGSCQIICGDARELEGLLADKCIFSPPFAEAKFDTKHGIKGELSPNLKGRKVWEERFNGNPTNPDNIANLPYGQVNKIISSPPYSDISMGGRLNTKPPREGSNDQSSRSPDSPSQSGAGKYDKIITSPQRKSKSDLSIVYVAFFEMNNPIVLLVKTLISSSIFSSLSERAMPEITISFNDSGKSRQEEVHEISTNSELADKLNSLLVKVFGNRAFKVREPSFPITYKGTEDTPITCKTVWLDIEGIATQSTMALYIGSASSIKTFTGTKYSDLSFNLISPYPELLIACRASSPNTSPHTGTSTKTGTVFASIVGQLAGSAGENLPTDSAFLFNNNSLSHNIIPLSILLQSTPLVNHIITSPPYEGIEARDRSKESWWNEEREKEMSGGSAKIAKGYQADAVITSPPYEGSLQASSRHTKGGIPGRDKVLGQTGTYGTLEDAEIIARKISKGFQSDKAIEIIKGSARGYAQNLDNIGNLKGNTYLSEMLKVYEQCYAVLRPSGLMILVVKNFIREQKEVDLKGDTVKLCEQAGFHFVEEHHRLLPSQSFWRVIYKKRYPDAPVIDREYVLIFEKVV